MTDKQWVVVPREPTQEMIEACRSGLLGELGKALVDKQSTAAYLAMLAASPRYEPGDAVEAACKAIAEFNESPNTDWISRPIVAAGINAAFPALVARVGELEAAIIVAQNATNLAQGRAELAEAEVERLKGAK